MGFTKIEHSEKKKEENDLKAETELTERKKSTEDTPIAPPDCPKASTSASLTAIFDGITSTKEKWPEEVFQKVLSRFGRMPRTGWSQALSVYCSKFGVRTPQQEFKKKATRGLINTSGRKCSSREFKNDSVKRVKTLDEIFEENTLFEAKIYNVTKNSFLEYIRGNEDVEVDKAERTRKFPNEKINHIVLDAVTRAVSEYVHTKPPSNMREVAKTIHAAQAVYQQESTKQSQPSNWRESIEGKIKVF